MSFFSGPSIIAPSRLLPFPLATLTLSNHLTNTVASILCPQHHRILASRRKQTPYEVYIHSCNTKISADVIIFVVLVGRSVLHRNLPPSAAVEHSVNLCRTAPAVIFALSRLITICQHVYLLLRRSPAACIKPSPDDAADQSSWPEPPESAHVLCTAE